MLRANKIFVRHAQAGVTAADQEMIDVSLSG